MTFRVSEGDVIVERCNPIVAIVSGMSMFKARTASSSRENYICSVKQRSQDLQPRFHLYMVKSCWNC